MNQDNYNQMLSSPASTEFQPNPTGHLRFKGGRLQQEFKTKSYQFMSAEGNGWMPELIEWRDVPATPTQSQQEPRW